MTTDNKDGGITKQLHSSCIQPNKDSVYELVEVGTIVLTVPVLFTLQGTVKSTKNVVYIVIYFRVAYQIFTLLAVSQFSGKPWNIVLH